MAVPNVSSELQQEFIKTQQELLKKVNLKNNFLIGEIKLIAGVDLAYWNEDNVDYAVCCIVIIDYVTKQVIEEVHHSDVVKVPYISGFLAFRELPLVLETVKKLKSKPDMFMFDGNGYLHYRHMGIATHASIFLNKPTIGVAKNYLKIKDVDFIMPENREGAYTDIVIHDEVYGRALRSRKDVKPIFVSCGNWIDVDTTTEIVLHFIEKDSRLPLPTRFADIYTHKVRKEMKSKKID
ncbi:endonuclease V [Neobacillus mesonae]|uniref:endonuclease V n=1 Tax=Neobacillus mesonae TaxID=1193713 RepID=UPI002041DE7C|nr:endonuclease V [Neobacillus mesonae]MCM3569788.1 endonuclease V [Neobacillus mesonae]